MRNDKLQCQLQWTWQSNKQNKLTYRSAVEAGCHLIHLGERSGSCTYCLSDVSFIFIARCQLLPPGYCRCLHLCVCSSMCVNHKLVCVICSRPLKLKSPNLDQKCKIPWLRSLLFIYLFLAATKQLYEWFSPSVCLSVRPSVCLSHLFDYVPIIVSSWNFQELLPVTKVTSMQKVKVKGQGHRGHNPTSPFPDCNSSLNSHMMMKWCI